MGFLSDWPKKYGEEKIGGIDPSASPQHFLGQILNNIVGDKQAEDGDSVRESASPVDFIAPEAAGALRGMAGRGAQVLTEAAPRILGNEIGSIGSNVKPKFDNLKQVFDNKISLHPEYDLPENTILGKQHQASGVVNEEVGVNHRLNGIDDVNYAVKDGKVIGHLGVDDRDSIKTIFVDQDHRRKGVAEQLYTDYAKKNGVLHSDDLDAMEPEAKALWKKLDKKYPGQITKGENKWTWEYNESLPEQSPHSNITNLVDQEAIEQKRFDNFDNFKNGLDMSREARLARAREMGYDTDSVFYHGTNQDIEKFDPRKSQSTPGSFFTKDPTFAEEFSGTKKGANILPVYTKTNNLFDPDNASHIKMLEDWHGSLPLDQRIEYNKIASLEDVIGSHPLLPNQRYITSPKTGWISSETPLVSDFLKANNFDGQHIYESNRKNIHIINPRKVRSINADFDPLKADSTDLLADNDKFEALKKLLTKKA